MDTYHHSKDTLIVVMEMVVINLFYWMLLNLANPASLHCNIPNEQFRKGINFLVRPNPKDSLIKGIGSRNTDCIYLKWGPFAQNRVQYNLKLVLGGFK